LHAAFVPKPCCATSKTVMEESLNAPAQASTRSLGGLCLPIAGNVPESL
jgi:hypothetical protein